MKPFTIRGDGNIPVILHLPHNSTFFPPEFISDLNVTDLSTEVHTLVDHHTDILYQPILEMGGLVFENPYCRIFFDPERFAEPEKEIMNDVGMGVFYTHTTNQIRFRQDDNQQQYQDKLNRFYWLYHNALSEITQKVLDRFGRVLFIDGHSYPLTCFPFERYPNDLRPEVDIGTDMFHTPNELLAYTKEVFEKTYSVGIDQPFKGTLIPNGFYGTERNICAMMLEVRRDVYLNDYESGSIDINHAGIQRFHQHLKKIINYFITA